MSREGLSLGLFLGLFCLAGARAANDTLSAAQIKSGGAVIDVTFAPGKLDLPESKVVAWITDAANAVSVYYGHFPVSHARVFVRPAEGRSGVFNGTTWGSPHAFTRISIGQQTDEEKLHNDWMMTHELTHLAFPDVEGDEHHWIEEGMATYIEPIARAQNGKLSVERVWGEMAHYMPEGQPEYGDQGLDNTHTWGRTYWGGAIFWVLADVQIRERTGNRKGLQDAMRAILNAGGNIENEWPIRRILQVGDRATGGTVLMDLYNQMRDKPVQTDLNDLWRKLGVSVHNDAVTFDDRAPLARVRKAITAKR